MSSFPNHTLIRCTALLLPAICFVASACAKDLPPMKTLAQMAHEKGVDPDYREAGSKYTNMAQGIPRDFPVPAGSNELHFSNVMPAASISGSPQQAKAFYENGIFKTQNWTVQDRNEMVYNGKIEYGIVACKLGQCVNLSSSNDDPHSKNTIKFLFFKK
jgi:hypothetical protein